MACVGAVGGGYCFSFHYCFCCCYSTRIGSQFTRARLRAIISRFLSDPLSRIQMVRRLSDIQVQVDTHLRNHSMTRAPSNRFIETEIIVAYRLQVSNISHQFRLTILSSHFDIFEFFLYSFSYYSRQMRWEPYIPLVGRSTLCNVCMTSQYSLELVAVIPESLKNRSWAL